MRLSEILNNAPDSSKCQVENFLGKYDIPWGETTLIEVGLVIRSYFCHTCGGNRSFVSPPELSCLVTGTRTVSIDATLRCVGCTASTEVWFLIATDDDLYSPAPLVHLERFTEHRRDGISIEMSGTRQFNDLFERAQVAFHNHLAAGAMVYLRKILELATIQAASATGIATTRPTGSRKPFRDLLEEVDRECQIIPLRFSSNGYRLFSELSEVIHGDSDEGEALSKYDPCRELVSGIVNNIQNNERMLLATTVLGWTENPTTIVSKEG